MSYAEHSFNRFIGRLDAGEHPRVPVTGYEVAMINSPSLTSITFALTPNKQKRVTFRENLKEPEDRAEKLSRKPPNSLKCTHLGQHPVTVNKYINKHMNTSPHQHIWFVFFSWLNIACNLLGSCGASNIQVPVNERSP